ncbi:uncharacterized protein LOC133838092 isoform X1 [Drosophila sulfurigaster albostrigata]|uniref:uncharacterized protein LOC133838092 isoform X1 n=2 Tax=Drosophila sulfurigaster albostrigata TaxID=89887 RepID=UPI002D21E239|nr:uncharacterized protein LOC133838092 isoform X1 [Drosophila sulfurigaster albostrigata]XP_062125041.1 uncharacterized protein LOC133838092 isoform X1 [Drosophila sulfurigaster albostrigata]
MSLIHEIIHQQLRRLFRAKRRSDDRRLSYSVGKRSRNRWQSHCYRRSPGGQDSHSETVTFRLSRQASLPVGNRCIVPLLHIWLRLNENTSTSNHITRQRCMRSIRLQQRSALENASQVVQIHWRNFCQMVWPASKQTTIATQTGRNPYVEIVQTNNYRNRLSWTQKLRIIFIKISKVLESALTDGSSSPGYINTSAAMELISIGDLFDQLNSVLVEHLIDNADYVITPSQSMTQFDFVFPE